MIAAGIDHVEVHHGRKATAENRKPTSLPDVYGSVWVTSSVGSVICLWGEPGDPLVEMLHLKQPSDDVGPLQLEHDHQHGITCRRERADAWSVLQQATTGITASEAAAEIYGTKASKAQVEKVRRRLARYLDDGLASSEKGSERTTRSSFGQPPETVAWTTVDLHVDAHATCTTLHNPPGTLTTQRPRTPNSSAPL